MPAEAAEGAQPAAAPPAATGMFTSAIAAYRQGIAAFRAGAVKTALPALKFAADQGVLGAQLQLAKLYSAGRDVPRDDAKAYDYYRQIADDYADIAPSSPIAPYVAGAFVALGRYQLSGIPSMRLRPNPVWAADLFRHAASYFGDPEAQYQLAQLYLTGKGVDKDVSLGVNWLAMAARKQHPESQAVLGRMLWKGEKVEPRYARGLALIALAHYNAKAAGNEPEWIKDLYVRAFTGLDTATVKQAEALIPYWGGPKLTLAPLPSSNMAVRAQQGATRPGTDMPVVTAPDIDAANRTDPPLQPKPSMLSKALLPEQQQAVLPPAGVPGHAAALPVSEASSAPAPGAAAPSASSRRAMGASVSYGNDPAGAAMHP